MADKVKNVGTFNEYQNLAAMTAMYRKNIDRALCGDSPRARKLLALSYVALGLGEAGEAQGKVKKIIRDCDGEITPEKKEQIKHELGDILWYVSAMCGELDLRLEDVATANIGKLYKRQVRGMLGGDGDDR